MGIKTECMQMQMEMLLECLVITNQKNKIAFIGLTFFFFIRINLKMFKKRGYSSFDLKGDEKGFCHCCFFLF